MVWPILLIATGLGGASGEFTQVLGRRIGKTGAFEVPGKPLPLDASLAWAGLPSEAMPRPSLVLPIPTAVGGPCDLAVSFGWTPPSIATCSPLLSIYGGLLDFLDLTHLLSLPYALLSLIAIWTISIDLVLGRVVLCSGVLGQGFVVLESPPGDEPRSSLSDLSSHSFSISISLPSHFRRTFRVSKRQYSAISDIFATSRKWKVDLENNDLE